MNRRDLLRAGLCGASAALVGGSARSVHGANAQGQAAAEPGQEGVPVQKRVCLFTDHLAGFGYDEVARMLADLGVAGPDLTVRPGGLVSPDKVEEELPKAVAAFAARGLSVPMITTALTSADDPAARPTLSAMRRLGIRYYKLGYYHYEDLAEWGSRLEATGRSIGGLCELGREADVTAGLHNHAGPTVGGAVWDSWQILEPLDAERVGFYFDPAQATIEGGVHAWKLNFQRVSSRVVMVAIKDFVWEKTSDGWRPRWCPLGEGMVRWGEFFGMLAESSFAGPMSLHIEYEPGGSSRAERFERSLAAAERDLAFLRKQLDAAFGPAASGTPP
jgi:sugar phosphate isomerase/epimerase